MSTTESGGEDIRSSLVIEFIFITLIAVPFDSVDACASIFLQTKIPFQLATWMTCDWCPIKRTIQKRFSSANNFPAAGPSRKQRGARFYDLYFRQQNI